MEYGTKQVVKMIQAAPGVGKTQYICSLISKRLRQERFIVALRDKNCADRFRQDMGKVLTDEDQELVQTIYSIESDDEYSSVSDRLEAALEDVSTRLIIICQKSLDGYLKWESVLGKFTLFVDELFDALYLYQKKLSPYLAEDLGISKATLGLIDVDTLSKAAYLIYKQSKGNAELHSEVLALLESLINAKFVSVKAHKGGFKIITLRESRVFDNFKHFRSVYMAAMICEGTLPYLIGTAKGIEFVNSDWEKQGTPFESDDKVSIIPLMKRDASQTFLNDPKGAAVKNFEKLFKKSIEILSSKNVSGKIYLMMNKDVKGVRDRLGVVTRNGLQDAIIDMGFNTHGKHDWEDGRKFSLLFTSRWNRDFNQIGEAYSASLGFSLDSLESAYEVTMQLEPITQAACRGQVRQGGNKCSWIVVLDVKTANYLKSSILHKAQIDTSHLLEMSTQVRNVTVRSNAGMKSVMKHKWALSPSQAKTVERRCNNAGVTDISNPEHLQLADAIVLKEYPEAVKLSTEYILC